ncbi:MAG TPA: serine/threonine-protein kinase, partial [Acidobacteriota bacterium]|nr:serine/threonine-protein kinase [Acidobacteriota bacterium]
MVGRTVSHYKITEELGRGAMGVVYKAEDTRLNRYITIKFPDEKYTANPKALERFKREARAISSLNHPNICTIYDVDEFEGRPYIAMEYVDGSTLKKLAGDAPLELNRFFDLGLQIVEGLEEAHSTGIVHRDIKPSNIMVARTGHAKILD